MKNTKSILVIICCQNPEKDKISKLAVKIDKIFKENQSYYIQPAVLSFSCVHKAAYIIANALKTLLYVDNILWEKGQNDFENFIKRAKKASEQFSYVVIVVDDDTHPYLISSELGWGNVMLSNSRDSERLKNLRNGHFSVLNEKENAITYYPSEKAGKQPVASHKEEVLA